MSGPISDIAGFAALVTAEFAGYAFAGSLLKKLQPLITTSVYRIAAVRIGLGIVVGPALALGMIFLADHFPVSHSHLAYQWGYSVGVFSMRVVIWILAILLFSKEFTLAKSKLLLYSVLGALWSGALDAVCIAIGLVSRPILL